MLSFSSNRSLPYFSRQEFSLNIKFTDSVTNQQTPGILRSPHPQHWGDGRDFPGLDDSGGWNSGSHACTAVALQAQPSTLGRINLQQILCRPQQVCLLEANNEKAQEIYPHYKQDSSHNCGWMKTLANKLCDSRREAIRWG